MKCSRFSFHEARDNSDCNSNTRTNGDDRNKSNAVFTLALNKEKLGGRKAICFWLERRINRLVDWWCLLAKTNCVNTEQHPQCWFKKQKKIEKKSENTKGAHFYGHADNSFNLICFYFYFFRSLESATERREGKFLQFFFSVDTSIPSISNSSDCIRRSHEFIGHFAEWPRRVKRKCIRAQVKKFICDRRSVKNEIHSARCTRSWSICTAHHHGQKWTIVPRMHACEIAYVHRDRAIRLYTGFCGIKFHFAITVKFACVRARATNSNTGFRFYYAHWKLLSVQLHIPIYIVQFLFQQNAAVETEKTRFHLFELHECISNARMHLKCKFNCHFTRRNWLHRL